MPMPIQRDLPTPSPSLIQEPSLTENVPTPQYQIGAQMPPPPQMMGPMPEDPRLTALYGQQAQLDAPQKPTLLGTLTNAARGLTPMDPAQFQQNERLRYGQEFSDRQTQKQNVAAQIRQILDKQHQDTDDQRQQEMLRLAQNQDQRQATAAPVALAHTAAETSALTAPKPAPASKGFGSSPLGIYSQDTGDVMHPATVKPATPPKPDFEWVTRDGKQVEIQKGSAKPGDIPFDAVAARQNTLGAGESPYSKERALRTVQSVDELKKKVSAWTVGYGSTLSSIPESDARNFKAELDTLKANIAFNELAQMRNASKTGGALGAVSDKEGQLLQSALGALDTGQSAENFSGQLDKIKASIERWQQAMETQGGAPKPATTANSLDDEILGLLNKGKK